MDTFINIAAAVVALVIVGCGCALAIYITWWFISKIKANIAKMKPEPEPSPQPQGIPLSERGPGTDKQPFSIDLPPDPTVNFSNRVPGIDIVNPDVTEAELAKGHISLEEIDRRWPYMSGQAQFHMRGQGYFPPDERARRPHLSDQDVVDGIQGKGL